MAKVIQDSQLKNILIVEDNADDVKLMRRALEKSGMQLEFRLADDEASLRKALDEWHPDCILCDYSLPTLDGSRALSIVLESGLMVPFIVVSATIGDEKAAEIIKAGAADFVLKSKLHKLPSSIASALKEAERKVSEQKMRLRARELLGETRPPLPVANPWGDRDLRVLAIEDSTEDVDLLGTELRRQNIHFVLQNVIDEVGLRQVLTSFEPDVVVSDFILPTFDGLRALKVVREYKPYIPFVMLSGVLGENEAIETIQAGASDYVLKSDMKRLVPVIVRSIVEAQNCELREEAEKRFEKIFHHSPNGIVVSHRNGKIFSANYFVQILSGYAADELQNLNLGALIRDWLALSAALSRRQNRDSNNRYELRQLELVRKDGSTTVVEVGVTPVSLMGESLLLSTIVDLTDRKEAVRVQQLEQIAEQREEFVASLAHDLKTPLIGANRILEIILKQDEMLPNAMELLSEIRNSNLRIINMIENLIGVQRYEELEGNLYCRRTDLVKLLKACVNDIEATASVPGIKVNLRFPEKCEIECDEFAIQRVAQNLLDNAVKFAGDGGTIEIDLSLDREKVILNLFNTGALIPTEEICSLFQRFWRSSHARRYTPGTGIGLYYCRKVIEAHGGKIDCISSAESGGTRFLVTLPIHAMSGDRRTDSSITAGPH